VVYVGSLSVAKGVPLLIDAVSRFHSRFPQIRIRLSTHAEQEIASAGKAARMALKRYAAELAVGLAEQKVRARMTPDTEDALVQGFVRNLK